MEVPFQIAAHLRTGSPLLAGEIAGFELRTAVSQSGVATNEPPVRYLYKRRHFARYSPFNSPKETLQCHH
jgi:hypothetical protein